MGHHLADKGSCNQSYKCENCTIKKAERQRIDASAGEESWESLELQGDQSSQGKSALSVHWKDWCWSWNSNTLSTSCEELTRWKRPWCWEGLGAGEGDDRGWDGWMASPTQWTWVWGNCGSWWWTGRPGVLRFMGSQRIGHDWATEWPHYGNKAPSFIFIYFLKLPLLEWNVSLIYLEFFCTEGWSNAFFCKPFCCCHPRNHDD